MRLPWDRVTFNIWRTLKFYTHTLLGGFGLEEGKIRSCNEVIAAALAKFPNLSHSLCAWLRSALLRRGPVMTYTQDRVSGQGLFESMMRGFRTASLFDLVQKGDR